MAEQDSMIEMPMTFFTSIIELARPWGLETQPILDGAEVSDIDQLSRLLAAQLVSHLPIKLDYQSSSRSNTKGQQQNLTCIFRVPTTFVLSSSIPWRSKRS
uniref:Uncharacterized protein n=1 Tax=Populus trichocarpa TaxID=3694 RepID=B9III5_POPTR